MSEGGLEQQQLVLSSRRKFAKYFVCQEDAQLLVLDQLPLFLLPHPPSLRSLSSLRLSFLSMIDRIQYMYLCLYPHFSDDTYSFWC